MLVSFPTVEDGDRLRISATSYVTFKRCPAQANARFQGIYGPDSRASFVGNLAHRVFSRHLKSGPIDSADFDRVCKEEIGASSLNNKMAALGIKPSTLAPIIEEARSLYERFRKFPTDGFEGSEIAMGSEPLPGVELVGTVDAVYREDLGGHRLVDWKTGELGEPEDQLFFYALLWAIENEEMPAQIEAVSVRTGERYQTVPSTAEVQRVAGEVSGMAGTLRRSWSEGVDLERRGGPWCHHCPILEDCPEGQAAEALLG